jgi:hypothetical protein
VGIGLVSTSVKADADSTKEVTTAATHAGLAAQAADLKSTQTHLHHVINRLVGPKGQGFDDKEVNPCKDHKWDVRASNENAEARCHRRGRGGSK